MTLSQPLRPLRGRADQIVAYVKDHPGTSAKDVAGAVGMAHSSASTNLNILEAEGRVRSELKGDYSRSWFRI